MNPFTLRFPQPLEDEYLGEYVGESLRPLRIALIAGILLTAAVEALDSWVAPGDAGARLAFRYGLVVPTTRSGGGST